jgi:tRNA(Ile)-lysidine synthase
MDLIAKATSTIKKRLMLSGGEKVLIGLSGGADSVCLTAVLKKLSQQFKLSLHAVYIDHGLRPEETPDEIKFCKELCRSKDISFSEEKLDVKSYAKTKGLNKQEAARELRNQALEYLAQEIKADRIALGHNLYDQVETFFMRILRGSGRKGLASIPPVRGIIIRPLIDIDREEIEDYLSKESIGFITDSSNLKDEYLRNRLRKRLIPMLKDIDPSVMKTLSHTTDVFREEEEHFDIAVTKAMMRLISRKSDTSIELFMVPLEGMAPVLLRRVLRRCIDETRGLRGIGFVHIEDIIDLIKNGKPGNRLNLPKDIRVIKQYATLLITTEQPVKLGEYVLESGGETHLKEAGLVLKATISDNQASGLDGKSGITVDADKAPFPLLVRARKDGDYFYPLGFGKKKKLQDFFVDEKVPRDERLTVPIVTSGDEVLWVAGMRGDDRVKPTDETKRFLVLELKKARS